MSIADNFTCKQSAFNFFASEMRFFSEYQFDTICVAVSGGSDSLSLLIMVTNWAKERNIKIICVTVDHKLREESYEEAVFVREFCKSIGIAHVILEWNRSQNVILCEGKIESLAREARYRILTDFCKENSIKFLFTGHTWNDQLETFEMRKAAGSSDCGLAGMSRIRTLSKNLIFLRPILHFTKEYLQKFLISENIEWKNDPMNDCEAFKRIACRKKIMTYDEKTLYDLQKMIKEFGKIRNAIETNAVNFIKNEKFCFFSDTGFVVLDFPMFNNETTEVQSEIIKRVVWNVGGKKYATNIKKDVLQKIIRGKINTIGRCLFKVNKESITISRENRNKKINFELPYVIGNNKVDLFDIFSC